MPVPSVGQQGGECDHTQGEGMAIPTHHRREQPPFQGKSQNARAWTDLLGRPRRRRKAGRGVEGAVQTPGQGPTLPLGPHTHRGGAEVLARPPLSPELIPTPPVPSLPWTLFQPELNRSPPNHELITFQPNLLSGKNIHLSPVSE